MDYAAESKREVDSLLKRHPAPRRSKAKGVDGGIYTAEMGAPPQDIDGASVRPVKKAKGGSVKGYAEGGSVTRADGCVSKGHTKGMMR